MINTLPRLVFISLLLCQLNYLASGCPPCVAATVRFATFNVSLYDNAEHKLAERLATKNDSRASALAEIIQRVRPDVLLLNEVDYDIAGKAIQNFQANYLAIGQNYSQSLDDPVKPIIYPYRFLAPSNTGIPANHDLDRNGRVNSPPGNSDYGGDCWGYGEYPGKYAMVLLSRYPIDEDAARTFQNFLWKDMPAARLPDDPSTTAVADWYSSAALAKFPLSSKSHWDVPINIGGHIVHVLASHPTPPTYDGPEDRNGRRNHDEIRFWVDYITPGKGDYIYDDRGVKKALTPDADFVIMGDLNGDPIDGQGKAGIARLLSSTRISCDPVPASAGGAEQAKLQGGANLTHQGDPSHDTLDAADGIGDSKNRGPGNLRVDYVLPARKMKTLASGVFWPKNEGPRFSLVGTHPFPSSDHRLVWVDVAIDDVAKEK